MEPEYTAYQPLAPRPGRLRRLPHRPRRRLVREVQALRLLAGHLASTFDLYPTPDPDAGAQPAPGARHLRAVPLADQVRRRPAGGQDPLRRRRGEHRAEDACCCCGSAASRAGAARASTGTSSPEIKIRYRSDDDAREDLRGRADAAGRHGRTLFRPERGRRRGARRRSWRDHGLRRLPQPADPHLPAARARRWTRRSRRAASTARCPSCGARASGCSSESYASHDEAAAGNRRRPARVLPREPPRAWPPTARRAIDAAGRGHRRASTRGTSSPDEHQLGHLPQPHRPRDVAGCFRCHDDEHATDDGETISQDCDTCHSLLAMEEEDPAILDELNP